MPDAERSAAAASAKPYPAAQASSPPGVNRNSRA